VKGSSDTSTVNIENEMLNLSHEQVQLFEKRYEEGYDLPDPVYLKWLEITHPKHDQTTDHFQWHYEENCDFPDPYPEQCNESVSLSELVHDSNSCKTLGLECSIVESVTASHVEDANAMTTLTDELSCPGPSYLSSNAITSAPRVEPPDHEGELNYISKYLIQYVPVKKIPKASKRATGARVLTSDECAKSIFEKDEKKRKEKEEKEARKVEREQKKKEREEATKQKAEKNCQEKGRSC